MRSLIMVLGIAFVVSWLMTPVCIKLAPKIGAVDIPKDGRRMHSKPIPRFGGLAIYLGTMAAILIMAPHTMKVMGIVLGGTFIYLVGLYDDLRDMSATSGIQMCSTRMMKATCTTQSIARTGSLLLNISEAQAVLQPMSV